MGTDTTLSIALIIAVGGFAITILNFISNNRSAIRKSTKEEDSTMEDIRTSCIKQNVKLDNISAAIGDIKADVKATQKQLSDSTTEIAVIKRDLKTAFSKIDSLEERMSK